jgi:hypothetical protein
MHTEQDDGLPPIAGSWHRLYVAVLIVLALVIAGAWLFSRAYS